MSTVQCGPMRIRCDAIRAGQIVLGHAHKHGHMTYVPKGAIKFERLELLKEFVHDGRAFEQNGLFFTPVRTVVKRARSLGNFIYIEKGVWHRLTALKDSHYHCIYPLRDANGEIVEEMSFHDGWEADYA